MIEIEYKKISENAKKEMIKSLNSSYDYYTEAVNSIQSILPSNETYVLNSANSCIFTVVEAIPEPILIPDEGGWNGLQKSAKILNKKIEEISTDNAMINIENLKQYFNSNDISSLYITSLCAYTAPQYIDEIYELCKLYNVILILDISPSVGEKELNINNCDIQIASTGSPKIVNIENGGFINNISQKIELNKHLLKTFKADNITCAGISSEIPHSTEILEKTMKYTWYLKEKLVKHLKNDQKHDIIHPTKKGLNIIITEESNKKARTLSYKIRKEIRVDNNKSIITTGPNYNRLKRACVVLEIKNIDHKCLNYELMDELFEVVINAINDNQ